MLYSHSYKIFSIFSPLYSIKKPGKHLIHMNLFIVPKEVFWVGHDYKPPSKYIDISKIYLFWEKKKTFHFLHCILIRMENKNPRAFTKLSSLFLCY